MRACADTDHCKHMGITYVFVPVGRKPLRIRYPQIHNSENDQTNLEMGRRYMGRPKTDFIQMGSRQYSHADFPYMV